MGIFIYFLSFQKFLEITLPRFYFRVSFKIQTKINLKVRSKGGRYLREPLQQNQESQKHLLKMRPIGK